MNTSGGPVKQLMNAYGVSPDRLVVIHDELDIDPGTIRVKFGGGHAGHNGLRSICEAIMMDTMFDIPSTDARKFTVTLPYAKKKIEKANILELKQVG